MNATGYELYHDRKFCGFADFPFTVLRHRIPTEISCVSLHWQEEMELVFIKEGSGIVSVDLEDYPVSAGYIVLILPGQLHSIQCTCGASMQYDTMLFPLSLLTGSEQDSCTRDYFLPLSRGIFNFPQVIIPSLGWYQAFADCFNEACEICRYYPTAYPLAIKSKLFQMFYILFYNETKPEPKSRPQKSIDKTKQILQYISEHYKTRLSIEKMAQACQLSESHFMKFFKSVTGMTFTEYVNDCRLTAAAHSLLSTQAPITEIASDCGFENVSYFNRLFRRKYHTTPTKYRASKGS